jgi:hypothetical protein
MAEQRTWTDQTGDNEANNPLNWTPTGTPEPGDSLTLPSGSTIDIRDNVLQGDALTIPAGSSQTVTLNLTRHAQVSLSAPSFDFPPFVPPAGQAIANIRGADTLNWQGGVSSSLTVNLEDHAALTGSFSTGFRGSVVIAGGEHSRFINDGTSSLSGSTVTVDTDVVGHGTFVVRSSAFVTPGNSQAGFLEFGGLVSRGQAVDLTGGQPDLVRIATVKIDDPKDFHGTVDLHNLSLADLVGLAEADRWTYHNDMLSIFNACGRVVDKLHVISDASSTGSVHGLSVSRYVAGDVLVRPGTDFHGSLAAPTV